jgi:hypothetical protein
MAKFVQRCALTNVNSDRGFESCPNVGYEVEPPACQCSVLEAHGQWTLDFPATGRMFGD